MNIAIYARFSSNGQREESIEGQLDACRKYADNNGHTIIDTYIDRARTGTDDNRPQFQRMIKDAKTGKFQMILVYQYDRFFRDAGKSALYKEMLKKDGVSVVSALEPLPDGSARIITEGMIDLLAEYYSADLSVKTKRGMNINAHKKKFNGGRPPFGYSIIDGYFEINEETAPIVQEIFTDYINLKPIKTILDGLNRRHILNTNGKPFTYASITYLLSNKRYTGYYIYDDIEIEDDGLAIIDEETFLLAQEQLGKAKHRKSSSDYMLSSKLYCGNCENGMTGTSGTSRTGEVYYYYVCKGKRKKVCSKCNVKREFIESIVLDECKKLLTAKNIRDIAIEASKIYNEERNTSLVPVLQKELTRIENSISNLLKLVELGGLDDTVIPRLKELQAEKESIKTQIAEENHSMLSLTEDEVIFYLYQLKQGRANSKAHHKVLIDTFVNRVYLFDDHCTIYLNTSDKPIEIKTNLLEEGLSFSSGSYNFSLAPPLGIEPRTNL